MTIQQLSIFLDNKVGSLNDILQLFKKLNIQIIASSIADTVDFGIYRIITPDPETAANVLREQGISVNVNDVFALSLDNKAGKAADAVAYFSNAGVNISYMYSFLIKERGILIFRTDKPELAKQIIEKNQLPFFRACELNGLC
ncbi:MAG: amino acid-binding protein [Bacteroidales bacterium]|jgi:hypothetical protein|nr:amino acid-binding protein [Bacteroidales bacterium]MDD3167221.1 amino acid-binding protein [Bacteroidales bacterium]MDD4770630.1 amino acid-binding protein [Bacteroidales bacterium]HKL91688.1 hypothetical protein [Bacteroidales bacterium]